MRRNIMVLGLALSLLLMGQTVRVGAAEQENLLRNAGFEEIVPYTINEPKYRDALPGVTEIPKGWGINYSAYPGKLTVIYDAITSHGGSKYVKMESEGYRTRRQGGSHFVQGRFALSPGKKYVIRIWAKGEGGINLGVYGYSMPRGGKFIPGFGSGWMEVNSPEKWQEYQFEFDPKTKPDIKGVAIFFAVAGTVYLDDAYFAPLPKEENPE